MNRKIKAINQKLTQQTTQQTPHPTQAPQPNPNTKPTKTPDQIQEEDIIKDIFTKVLKVRNLQANSHQHTQPKPDLQQEQQTQPNTQPEQQTQPDTQQTKPDPQQTQPDTQINLNTQIKKEIKKEGKSMFSFGVEKSLTIDFADIQETDLKIKFIEDNKLNAIKLEIADQKDIKIMVTKNNVIIITSDTEKRSVIATETKNIENIDILLNILHINITEEIYRDLYSAVKQILTDYKQYRQVIIKNIDSLSERELLKEIPKKLKEQIESYSALKNRISNDINKNRLTMLKEFIIKAENFTEEAIAKQAEQQNQQTNQDTDKQTEQVINQATETLRTLHEKEVELDRTMEILRNAIKEHNRRIDQLAEENRLLSSISESFYSTMSEYIEETIESIEAIKATQTNPNTDQDTKQQQTQTQTHTQSIDKSIYFTKEEIENAINYLSKI